MRAVAKTTIRRLGVFRDPLIRFLDFKNETMQLSSLYTIGAARMRGAHDLAIAHANVERVYGRLDEESAACEIESERELSVLAVSESDGGFRLLNAHMLVGVWGVFESSIDEFVVRWMADHPEDLACLPEDEVKLRPAAVFAPSPADRAAMLLDALKKRRGLPLARGVKRFEDVLSFVGLNGPLPPGLSQAIYEMQQVRNLYAHRGGTVDAHFLEAVPDLPLGLDDPVPVTPEIACGYYGALSAYVTVVALRAWARLGIRCTPDATYFWEKNLSSGDVLENLGYVWPEETPLRQHYAVTEEAQSG